MCPTVSPGADASVHSLSATEGEEELEVLVMPDYRDVNPYQLELEEALERQNVSVTTLGKGGKWFPVLQAVNTHGVHDVLHFHFFHQLMLGSLLPWRGPPVTSMLLSLRLVFELTVVKLLGTRLVWTAHDLVNHERRAMRTELAFKHLIIRFLCDDVIVHCDRAVSVLRDTYRLPEAIAEKTTVVPHGHFIDDYPNEVTQREAREQLEVPSEATVFLFFGWIRRYKNVPLLIDAFAGLETDQARLLVAGNPRNDTIERDVRRHAAEDDRVRLSLEFVPDADVQLYMNAADAVVLPFRTERMSLLTSGSALLAMSFGKPLIAPDIGCLGSLLDPTGSFPYESTSRAALLDAFRSALSADLDAMGRHNYETARRLDWDTIAAKTLRVYGEGSAGATGAG